jgi:hypothetical protein
LGAFRASAADSIQAGIPDGIQTVRKTVGDPPWSKDSPAKFILHVIYLLECNFLPLINIPLRYLFL